MAHWNDFNPWARTCIYISYDEMREILGQNLQDETLAAYGSRLDAYILPQPGGTYCFGIRYGAEPGEYLSLRISTTQGNRIMEKQK